MRQSNPFCVSEIAGAPGAGLAVCRRCPRLVAWREGQAGHVPARFLEWTRTHGFWGAPVPAFGDCLAWPAIVGLAPAAQGANRTGRMFTGDRSGDFLWAGLHRRGWASHARSEGRDDGLEVAGVLITAALRCAPPANRPSAVEVKNCRPYLRGDLGRLVNLRVVLALGRLAHDAVLAAVGAATGRPRTRFRHGAAAELAGGVWLVDSYHVSQQNTFTGRLTAAMFDDVLTLCDTLGGVGRPPAAWPPG